MALRTSSSTLLSGTTAFIQHILETDPSTLTKNIFTLWLHKCKVLVHERSSDFVQKSVQLYTIQHFLIVKEHYKGDCFLVHLFLSLLFSEPIVEFHAAENQTIRFIWIVHYGFMFRNILLSEFFKKYFNKLQKFNRPIKRPIIWIRFHCTWEYSSRIMPVYSNTTNNIFWLNILTSWYQFPDEKLFAFQKSKLSPYFRKHAFLFYTSFLYQL